MMDADDRIAGRYRVEGRLGVGGMSTVLLATDERLERKVAVKLLAEHLADDPTFISRFRREALAAARLVHPNIVQVFDFGFDDDSKQHFIVMEYVPGQSCAQLLRDRGRLDVEEAIDIVTQACNGLEYAHRHGVIHRDVKPGNLMLSQSGVIKLADFGIARATGQSAITQIGSVLGTAAYLSPEQTRGEDAGPYADLYALGVVTYQMLSGRLPYEASSLSELALRQQRELPPALSELDRSIPQALSDAVAAAISVVPAERPSDALALSASLTNGMRGVEPPTRRPLTADETAATRIMSPLDDETGATMVAPGGALGDLRAPYYSEPVPAPPLRRRPSPAQRSQGNLAPRERRGAEPRDRRDAEPRDRGSRSQPRSHHRGLRRFGVLLVLLVLIVLVVVIVVAIHGSGSSTVVHYQKVVASDARNGISQLQTLINRYTSK
jgi:serine/threonine protein kinase